MFVGIESTYLCLHIVTLATAEFTNWAWWQTSKTSSASQQSLGYDLSSRDPWSELRKTPCLFCSCKVKYNICCSVVCVYMEYVYVVCVCVCSVCCLCVCVVCVCSVCVCAYVPWMSFQEKAVVHIIIQTIPTRLYQVLGTLRDQTFYCRLHSECYVNGIVKKQLASL